MRHRQKNCRFLVALIVASLFSISHAVTKEGSAALREEIREAFVFTYDNYIEHAFPLDELSPISCAGEDTLGGYALTLVDALDSLALLGNHTGNNNNNRMCV